MVEIKQLDLGRQESFVGTGEAAERLIAFAVLTKELCLILSIHKATCSTP